MEQKEKKKEAKGKCMKAGKEEEVKGKKGK